MITNAARLSLIQAEMKHSMKLFLKIVKPKIGLLRRESLIGRAEETRLPKLRLKSLIFLITQKEGIPVSYLQPTSLDLDLP